ncbi:MAG: type II CAAX endopeptidase family protein [Planctomycetaceae bacterium]|nr:type II CAAX endopeptidase family protein [Planctomycetaceae bacterium]
MLPSVAKPDRLRPPWAALGAIGWTSFVLLNHLWVAAEKFVGKGTIERAELQSGHVWLNLLMSVGVFTVLAVLLFWERRFTPRDAGMVPSRYTIPLGLGTFFAAVLPTFAALLALSPFRSRETQHQLLQLLGRSPDVVTLAGLAVAVVVIAPLAEELLFRVTLQGWLTERLGSNLAVPLIALVFAGVHGWRDGLALIPLALLLGHVYDRRQDFFAVVIAHGAFNGANLVLALLSLPGS